MSLLRVILAIIFPPLAVLGYGCGSFLIVFILTCCGWLPGVIGALVILNNPEHSGGKGLSNTAIILILIVALIYMASVGTFTYQTFVAQ